MNSDRRGKRMRKYDHLPTTDPTLANLVDPWATSSCNFLPFKAFNNYSMDSLSEVAPASLRSFVISSAARNKD
jgi:hypothetical protein